MSQLTPYEYILYFTGYGSSSRLYFRRGYVPNGIVVPGDTLFRCNVDNGYVEVTTLNSSYAVLINFRVSLPIGSQALNRYIITMQHGSGAASSTYNYGFFYPIIEKGISVIYATVNFRLSSRIAVDNIFYVGIAGYIDSSTFDRLPEGFTATVNYLAYPRTDDIPVVNP